MKFNKTLSEEYKKGIKIIDSCKTIEQIESAINWINLFGKKHKKDAFHFILLIQFAVCKGQLIESNEKC